MVKNKNLQGKQGNSQKKLKLEYPDVESYLLKRFHQCLDKKFQ